jgi:acylglycerol lipase
MLGSINPVICAFCHGDDKPATAVIPQVRSVECADGYWLRYRTWSPVQMPRATLVLLNGVMSHSGWFQPLADHLVSAGLKLVGADRRGTGLNQEGRGDAPSAATLIDDVTRIFHAERLEGIPVHLGGWCWGAVLAVNVAAACQRELASLALLAPGFHPSKAVAMRMKEQDLLASRTACAWLEVPISDEMFTRGPFLAAIAADELRCRRVSQGFHRIMQKLALGAALRLQQLKLPMLLVLAEADEAVDNAQTREALESIRRSRVTVEVITGAHGLQFDAPARLAQVLASFMGAAATSDACDES